MIIIPAIDIKNGKCVRLRQGRMDSETVFGEDPAAMALRWEADGAEMIHVVDLDGAVEKKPRNLVSIKRILDAVKIPIQVGGGIRDIETIEMYLSVGIRRIIIGTEAIRNPALVEEACRNHPGRIVVGIDAREGLVAIEGWTETTRTRAVELARRFEQSGVAAINFTDIHRDGMQTGPNLEATRELAESVSIPVVASGGVSTLRDIRNLMPLEPFGVIGVITGKALYAGTLNLKEAIDLTR
ncbi:1-(5-phosphoribosyl)-5-[(5-phosphoribosylamino)methylideneamino]imidazole-4-carboxamide isomerase [Desulfococcus sp.]|uniref:1-(5-phosphoribosyl)-5-[(5- phosphoribosylamino)methylideneamino]imidazole-4- carboxamide isomerase n=1 Tax=Desulfococcus sp. TaxID=2025834 RepID=UPI003D12739A